MFFPLIKKSKSGFTLIELLVVIAIIGILSSVVLASLNTARRKSRDARRITDIKQIQLALELYFDGIGGSNYPTGAAGICTAVAGATDTENNGLGALENNGYIASVPRDPGNTASCYRYAHGVSVAAGPRTLYHLAAILEDTTSIVFNTDKDCDNSVSGSCGGTGAFVGVATQGLNTAACTGVAGLAGTDRCFDVGP